MWRIVSASSNWCKKKPTFSLLEEDDPHKNDILTHLYDRKKKTVLLRKKQDNISVLFCQAAAVLKLVYSSQANSADATARSAMKEDLPKKKGKSHHCTPGVRKRFRCLCSRTWFWEFPLQKFCRNVCARVMISFIFSSLCKGRSKQIKAKIIRENERQKDRDQEQGQRVVPSAVLVVAHRLVGDLQQVQHHSVGPHVLQQPLLLHATLLAGITQLTEPQQDLNIRHTRPL